MASNNSTTAGCKTSWGVRVDCVCACAETGLGCSSVYVCTWIRVMHDTAHTLNANQRVGTQMLSTRMAHFLLLGLDGYA
jgi:hypothetical protein